MARKVVHGGSRLQVQQEREGTWTKTKRAEMLTELAVTLNIAASCRKVGMSERGFQKLRRRDPEFRADFEQVIRECYDALELKYLERGTHGTRRPVFQGGKRIGEIVEYPDKVTLALLRVHRETAMRVREADRARAEELELAKIRLAEKLSDMNRRMGGNG
jgi:hypothetical protein